MSWQTFIRKLEKDFRISDIELQVKTSISSKVFYNIKKGVTKHPNQLTIKKLEEGLSIKIDDSNPDKIIYSQNLFDQDIELFNVEGNEFPVVSQILGEDLFTNTNIIGTIVLPYPKKDNCFVMIYSESRPYGKIQRGDKILFDIDAEVEDGSLCACRLKSPVSFIRYYRRLPENYIVFYTENPQEEFIAVKESEIEFIAVARLVLRNL